MTSGARDGAVHGAGVWLGNSAWWSSGRDVRCEEEEGKLVPGVGVSVSETGEAGVERARAVGVADERARVLCCRVVRRAKTGANMRVRS